MRKVAKPPADGLIRVHFEAGKSTGQIAKELGVERDVVASARHRIFEGRVRSIDLYEYGRPMPREDETKVTVPASPYNADSRPRNVISLPRIISLYGAFKEQA